MKIGIEAQRIFRKNKHGMDYVVLQEIKELQQMDTRNEYYIFVKPGEDHCVKDSTNMHVIIVPPIRFGNSMPCHVQPVNVVLTYYTVPAIRLLSAAGFHWC